MRPIAQPFLRILMCPVTTVCAIFALAITISCNHHPVAASIPDRSSSGDTSTSKPEEEPATQPSIDRNKLFHFSGPLGLSVQTIASEVSKAPDLRLQTHGVIVTDVESGSRAAAAAIMEGDIIVDVNRKPVKNTEEFYGAALASNSQPVLLLIERAGTRMFVVVE